MSPHRAHQIREGRQISCAVIRFLLAIGTGCTSAIASAHPRCRNHRVHILRRIPGCRYERRGGRLPGLEHGVNLRPRQLCVGARLAQVIFPALHLELRKILLLALRRLVLPHIFVVERLRLFELVVRNGLRDL